MKIAMIGHKRIPGREGGVEVVVEELAIRMAKDNDVVVYNRNSKRFSKTDFLTRTPSSFSFWELVLHLP